MSGETMQFIGFGVLIIGSFAAVVIAARRFEARQRQLGRWDEKGPLHPTKGPALGRGGMGERLEVSGQYEPDPDSRDDHGKEGGRGRADRPHRS